MSTKILLADKLKDGAFSTLEGVEVENRPELGANDLPEHLAGVNVLVVRSTKVPAAAIEAADALKLIVRAGSGYNNIDVEAATARGVYVANCPGRNSVAVAELAMGLILSIDRRIPDNVQDLREGRWNKAGYSKARGLKGQRLGLVGFGNIAQHVAKRAKAFDIEVASFSIPWIQEDADRLGVKKADSLEALFASSDIISLHVPATPATRGMITGALIGSMPEGAMLINTSRQEVVDNAALMAALEAGKIRVGTDVFPGEPEAKKGDFDDALGKHPGVYGTHHIGASTAQAQDEIAECAIDIVKTFIADGSVPLAVNTPAK